MRAVAALVVLAGLGLGEIDAASLSLVPSEPASGTEAEGFADISALPPKAWIGDRSTASPARSGQSGSVTSGGVTSGSGSAPRAGLLATPMPDLSRFATADAMAALHQDEARQDEARQDEARQDEAAMRDVPLPTGFWLIGAALIGLFTYGRMT